MGWLPGAWVAQLIEQLALDFGSGHDLRVLGSSPASGSVLSGESAWGYSLSPTPAFPSAQAHCLSRITKINLKKKLQMLPFVPTPIPHKQPLVPTDSTWKYPRSLHHPWVTPVSHGHAPFRSSFKPTQSAGSLTSTHLVITADLIWLQHCSTMSLPCLTKPAGPPHILLLQGPNPCLLFKKTTQENVVPSSLVLLSSMVLSACTCAHTHTHTQPPLPGGSTP